MSNFLKKFKKNVKENNLTEEEVKEYEKRIYELKELSKITCEKKDFDLLLKYGRELKKIKKILIRANNKVINNEKTDTKD